MKNYLIIFDNAQPGYDFTFFHNFIVNSPQVNDWWHHFANVYVITTSLDAKIIADSIITNFPGLRFFVLNINFNEYNGVLHTNAWNWIKQKKGQFIKLKAAPQPKPFKLSDLLPPITSTPPTQNVGLEELMKLLNLKK